PYLLPRRPGRVPLPAGDEGRLAVDHDAAGPEPAGEGQGRAVPEVARRRGIRHGVCLLQDDAGRIRWGCSACSPLPSMQTTARNGEARTGTACGPKPASLAASRADGAGVALVGVGPLQRLGAVVLEEGVGVAAGVREAVAGAVG